MAENPYERFQREELILRDELAIDRTILANERTALAYFRSALTLVIVGVTLLHFFEKGILLYFGIIFIPCGLAVGGFGIMRYRKMNLSIRIIRNSLKRNAENHKRPDKRSEATF
ncbi:MAG: DUF202 domain-containing protein [Pseudomonadota bacterium]